MPVSSFDILAATRSLESSGVPRAQAERITDTGQQVIDFLVASLATKEGLAASQASTQAAIDLLRADVKAMKAEMATKADLAALKAELFRALWMLSLGLATVILTGTGVLLALFRMF